MGFAGACQSAPLFHCFTDNGSARHNCAQGAPANNAPNPPYSAHFSAQMNFTHTAGCTYHNSQNTMHNLQFTMQTPQCNSYVCAQHKATVQLLDSVLLLLLLLQRKPQTSCSSSASITSSTRRSTSHTHTHIYPKYLTHIYPDYLKHLVYSTT